MAAVFIPPSPQTRPPTMSTRRPLANVPNATNSPRRAPLLTGKRAHPGISQNEGGYYYEPPLKKQVLDYGDTTARTLFQKPTSQVQDSKLFARKSNAPTSAFEKKLAAARDKGDQPIQSSFKVAKDAKTGMTTADVENIRMWQKYYRKVFPTFVFYFESIPDDARYKASRQIAALGAHEEKFFSKEVTHVVTTRLIPSLSEAEAAQRTSTSQGNLPIRNQNTNGALETVNPSLLDRTMLRGRPERQEFNSSQDVLFRARRMNMKIWSLDKLQRIVSTINDSDIGTQHGQYSRNVTASRTRGRAENDLSLALRNERLQGYADRDTFRDMVSFKGPFIYVHDMDEKTRPVMVREYPKVARRQDGIWPQFRSSRLGKCPFLIDEEPKKEPREKKPATKPKPAEAPVAPKEPLGPPPKPQIKPRVHEDPENDGGSEVSEIDERAALGPVLDATANLPVRPHSGGKNPEPSRQPIDNPAHSLRNHWPREPAASGVQPSNITSAIRSQMVSSAAGVPGANAATSKEVHELKRKVLEKSNGISMGGNPANYGHADASATDRHIRAPVSRAAKAKAQGSLAPVREDVKAQSTSKTRLGPICKTGNLKKAPKREPKPGYCENCREKFDDFDQHVATRKHRKFAHNQDNWEELDGLLDLLTRPVNPNYNGVALDIQEGPL